MPDDPLTMVATGVTYYSQADETAFFEWLDRMDCVECYRGALRDLFITLKRSPKKADLRELLALFFRYGVDVRQLARFETKSNRQWLRDPENYWHHAMFGVVEKPMPEVSGRTYEVIVGSDVAGRDGMYLEVYEGAEQLVEVFYSDADGSMTFTAYQRNLPYALVEWAIAQGKTRLVPGE